MKTDAAVAENSSDDAKDLRAPEPPLVIDPGRVVVQSRGFAFKELFARLPKAMTADHLKNGSVWRRVQGTATKALTKFDRVVVVGFDESWMAEGIVSEAGRTHAVLTELKVRQLGHRFEELFADGVHRVIWNGSGYGIERIEDGQIIGGSYANPQLATQALFGIYPKRA